MEIDRLIETRRSIRKFKNKKPDWRHIIESIDTMRFAPMAGGIFTLKVILVSDEEKINKIAKFCEQPFVATAQYLVVVCSDPKRLVNTYANKGKEYAHQQTGAAIENFLLKLTQKGLSTCWVGYFVENNIKNLLKVPEGYNVEAVFPIGFAAEVPRKKAKTDIDNILYFEEFNNKQMKYQRKLNC